MLENARRANFKTVELILKSIKIGHSYVKDRFRTEVIFEFLTLITVEN